MKEIEVKILEINPEEIKKKLLDLGAKRIGENKFAATIFDFEDGRIRKRGELLRLRKIGDKVELTYKSKEYKESDFKTAEEFETTVTDFNDMLKIFEKLGLKQTMYYEKIRESFKLNNAKIEIDTYPKIPTFIEIEAPTEEEVEKTVKILGFDMKNTTKKVLPEVAKLYNVDPTNLIFEK